MLLMLLSSCIRGAADRTAKERNTKRERQKERGEEKGQHLIEKVSVDDTDTVL